MSVYESIIGAKCKCIIGEVHCDAVIREHHSLTASMTQHATETGSENSDNYRAEPPVITIQAVISRNPLATTFPGQTAINSVANLIDGSDPVVAAWNEFKRYRDESEAIAIVTGKAFYANMMILNLDEDRDGNDWMIFNITAAKKNVAYTSVTEALSAESKETATTTLQDNQNTGAQSAEEAESSTVLADLLGL